MNNKFFKWVVYSFAVFGVLTLGAIIYDEIFPIKTNEQILQDAKRVSDLVTRLEIYRNEEAITRLDLKY